MFNYIDIISVSILFIGLYTMYSTWEISKNKRNTILLGILTTIIVYKSISFISNMEDNNSFRLINQMLVVMLVIYINSKKVKNKSLLAVIFINYLLSIGGINLLLNNDIMYSKLILGAMFVNTLYLSSIIFYIKKLSVEDKIVISLNIVYIIISLVIDIYPYYNNIGNFIEVFSSIIIFLKISRENMNNINDKSEDLNENLYFSNIEIEDYDERLEINKKITKTINSSVEKKKMLLNTILNQKNKCVFIIDEFGYITNKDESFYKFWDEYKDYKGDLNLHTFLDKSIKDKAKFLESVELVNKNNIEIEIELESNDDRYFLIKYSKLVVNNEDIGVICSVEDITYHRKSEKRIKENSTKYKNIVDNIPYSILLLEDQNIIYNNNKTNDINFREREVKRAINRCKQKEEISYIKNNEQVHLEIQKASFKDHESTKDVVAIRDLTNYKSILEKLRISKERYESLVDIIPEGIYTSSFDDYTLTYINSRGLDILGVKNKEEVDLEEINNSMLVTSFSENENIKFTRKSIENSLGEQHHIECGCMVIDVNKKLKVVGVIRDITEQVNSELMEIEIEKKKLEQKIKYEFFVNASHELKTPLNVISSSNQLLEILHKEEITKNPNGDIATVVDTVKNNTNNIMGLVNNIIDLAKLELNIHEDNLDFYNIVSLVEDATIEFNKCANTKGISILFDTDEEERIIKVDADYIEKVILILLSMSVRYSEKGSIINVDLNNKDDESVCINISNLEGYNYSRYVNDKERRSLDIAIAVAKQIIGIYGGKIDIKMSSSKKLEISVKLKIEKNIVDYKTRDIMPSNNIVYYECLSVCN